MANRVRKAVFPVAGLGTRLLPATKTIPKEMVTIVDRPSCRARSASLAPCPTRESLAPGRTRRTTGITRSISLQAACSFAR